MLTFSFVAVLPRLFDAVSVVVVLAFLFLVAAVAEVLC